ncbi:MAG TPA: hypothetical protein PLQ54_08235 [Armatimonadota bacterium]|nr:hypothetical protein [Armatimonadota bacterium]
MPLFRRLPLSFMPVAGLPVIGLGTYLLVSERSEATTDELDGLLALSQRLADRIDVHVSANQGLVRHLAATDHVVGFLAKRPRSEADRDTFDRWLALQSALSSEPIDIYAMDRTGPCVASTNRS